MKAEINSRGFEALVGEVVVWVDTTAINVVHIYCNSGKVVSIDAESSHYGIPVVSVGDWEGCTDESGKITVSV